MSTTDEYYRALQARLDAEFPEEGAVLDISVLRFQLASRDKQLREALAEIEKVKRGAATLGRIVASQNADALAAIGNPPDLIDETGDGDWAVVWERLAELRPERDAALARVRSLELAALSHDVENARLRRERGQAIEERNKALEGHDWLEDRHADMTDDIEAQAAEIARLRAAEVPLSANHGFAFQDDEGRVGLAFDGEYHFPYPSVDDACCEMFGGETVLALIPLAAWDRA